MKIVSMKFGWSNNSSSSHSIITGLNSWKNLTKDEIVDKFNPNGHMSYGEGACIDNMDDIVAYALYSYILDNFDYNHWDKTINGPHIELQALSRGYSEPLIKLIMKVIPYLVDIYVSDDNGAADQMAESNKMKDEDAFWFFVYNVAEVVD